MINSIKPIADLKAWINEHIKSNHERGITGANLNTALIDTIDSLESSSDSKVADCVKYTSQTKTTAEKTIARQNIDASTFVAIIEVTSYDDIKAAFDSGRTVVAKSDGEDDDYYTSIGVWSESFYFCQISDDGYVYQWYVNSDGWESSAFAANNNECVLYATQTKTTVEKAQARANIGANGFPVFEVTSGESRELSEEEYNLLVQSIAIHETNEFGASNFYYSCDFPDLIKLHIDELGVEEIGASVDRLFASASYSEDGSGKVMTDSFVTYAVCYCDDGTRTYPYLRFREN